MNTVIITVGQRDLQGHLSLEAQGLPGFESLRTASPGTKADGNMLRPPSEVRTFGEYLSKNDAWDEFLQAPIIEAILEGLQTKMLVGPITILFVVTDQPESAGAHRKGDTVYYPQILERILRKHPTLGTFLEKTTFDEFVIQHHVAELDVQYADFQKFIQSGSLLDPDELQTLYFAGQGGIDAINTALLLRLIEVFGHRVVHISKPLHGTTRFSDFPAQFAHNFLLHQIKAHYKTFHYASAFELALRNNLGNDVIGLLEVGRALETGNFSTAVELADNLGIGDVVEAFQALDFKYGGLTVKPHKAALCAIKLELCLLHLQHTGEHYWTIHYFYQFCEILANSQGVVKQSGEHFPQRILRLTNSNSKSGIFPILRRIYSEKTFTNLRNQSFLSHGQEIPSPTAVFKILGEPSDPNGALNQMIRLLKYQPSGFTRLNGYLEKKA